MADLKKKLMKYIENFYTFEIYYDKKIIWVSQIYDMKS